MKKFIFFSVPETSPTINLISVAQELANRGHEVVYYCSENYSSKFIGKEIEFRTFDINLKELSFNAPPRIVGKNILKVSEKIIDKHLEEIKEENPDCIIHDALCVWGKHIAQLLEVKAVCFVNTFVFDSMNLSKYINLSFYERICRFLRRRIFRFWKRIKRKRLFKKEAERYYEKYKIKNELIDIFMSTEEINIVNTSKFFQPKSELVEDNFKFVGPMIDEKREDEGEIAIKDWKNKKVIYISLGTQFNDNVLFYKKCIKAFGSKGFDKKEFVFIISLGHANKDIIGNLGEIPDNFIIKDYLPQLKILKNADVFISHSGMNSTQEAIYYGVPLISTPQQPEQFMVGKRVEDLNAGICLQEVDLNKLKLSVKKILGNRSWYEKNISRIQQSFEQNNQEKEAADEILNNYLSS